MYILHFGGIVFYKKLLWLLQQQSSVVAMEVEWPAEPKPFFIWPLTGKVC